MQYAHNSWQYEVTWNPSNTLVIYINYSAFQSLCGIHTGPYSCMNRCQLNINIMNMDNNQIPESCQSNKTVTHSQPLCKHLEKNCYGLYSPRYSSVVEPFAIPFLIIWTSGAPGFATKLTMNSVSQPVMQMTEHLLALAHWRSVNNAVQHSSLTLFVIGSILWMWTQLP